MQMLSPKVDYAFKKVFGNEKKPEILIGFLNDFLNFSGEKAICSIEYKNPTNDKNYAGEKLSVMDVKAETNKGEVINIEIQVHPDRSMIKRSLFYWARMFSEQNRPAGGYYKLLKKTISIIIMDYCLDELEGQDCHSVFELYERTTKSKLTDALELHYVELPKFVLSDHNQANIWLEFINNPLSQRVKEEVKVNKSLDMAYDEIHRMSLDELEREAYFAREKAFADFESRNCSAREEGLEKGRKEGLEKGLEEGLEKGLEEGREKERINTILRAMRKGRDKEFIFEEYECTEAEYQRALQEFEKNP